MLGLKRYYCNFIPAYAYFDAINKQECTFHMDRPIPKNLLNIERHSPQEPHFNFSISKQTLYFIHNCFKIHFVHHINTRTHYCN